jgi:hypothetical protein
MKRRLSPIYYIIPVLYVSVILFFVYMQFQAREGFEEKVGALAISGGYARSLGGGKRIRHMEVKFHDLRIDLAPSSGAVAGFGQGREKRLAVDSLSQFPDGFEVLLAGGTALRFMVEGSMGDRVVVTPVVPPQLRGMETLSLPFRSVEGTVKEVQGVALLTQSGPAGTVYASLSRGSWIDAEQGRFVMWLGADGSDHSLVLERVLEEPDPYVYWFSRNAALADQDQYMSKVESYLDRAYRYWNSVFLSNPGGRQLIGDLGISLISEAIKRGEYRKTLAVLSRNIRQLLVENAGNPALYESAAYLGNLPAFLSARQKSAAEEIQRITDLIRAADFAVFRTPHLLRFIVDHAPFSLAEEVLRLADSVQLETAGVDTRIYLVKVYLEAVNYLDVGEAIPARISEIIDRYILPAIATTSRGLFLSTDSSNGVSQVDLYESIVMGNCLMQAGRVLEEDSYTSLGRALIYSALDLADEEGFLPARVRLRGSEALPEEGRLSPQSIYELLPGSDYTPEEYPLYAYLYPGSWVWTVSRLTEVQIDDARYRFFFSFPVGDTHYLLIQGIRPMTSVLMHGILWKSDLEYFRYTDGWAYAEDTQTLFVKLTHRMETEELVLNY